MNPSRTLMACLTPSGRAAIATLALRGPDAWTLLGDLLSPRLPAAPKRGAIHLGRIGLAGGEDTVVLSVRETDPVPWLELHCHGGPEVVRLLVDLFTERGAAACAWPDFVRAIGGEASRVAAQILLANAPTVRTAGILLDQMNGAFANAVEEIRTLLRAGDTAAAKVKLDVLLSYAPVGRHLVEPWRLVIAGAPNVGKSSLANALAGYERSIVSPQPGTTRDVVTTALAIDGWPVEIADTAGLRADAAALEQEGIALAESAARAADLCLWVLDRSAAPVLPSAELGRLLPVINKVDLPAAWDAASVAGGIAVSALTGDGIAELCRSISETLVPDPPPPGAAVPFTAPFIERLQQARNACAGGDAPQALPLLVWPAP
jgi:tRNA modification GTPase